MLMDFGLTRHISLLVATIWRCRRRWRPRSRRDGADAGRRYIAAHAGSRSRRFPIDLAATVSIAWHRRTASDPAQSWFRALLLEAAGE